MISAAFLVATLLSSSPGQEAIVFQEMTKVVDCEQNRCAVSVEAIEELDVCGHPALVLMAKIHAPCAPESQRLFAERHSYFFLVLGDRAYSLNRQIVLSRGLGDPLFWEGIGAREASLPDALLPLLRGCSSAGLGEVGRLLGVYWDSVSACAGVPVTEVMASGHPEVGADVTVIPTKIRCQDDSTRIVVFRIINGSGKVSVTHCPSEKPSPDCPCPTQKPNPG